MKQVRSCFLIGPRLLDLVMRNKVLDFNKSIRAPGQSPNTLSSAFRVRFEQNRVRIVQQPRKLLDQAEPVSGLDTKIHRLAWFYDILRFCPA